MQQEVLNQLLQKLVSRGYAETVFLNPEYSNDFSMISL